MPHHEPLILKALREHGLDYLERDPDGLGIKVRPYEQGLAVLNYCQINSPKMDMVTQQCRGLIICTREWQVVSRSFDRFFNLGEGVCDGFELQPGDMVSEKADGSLIKLYHWGGGWRISTRGTAFAEAPVGESGRSFAELFIDAVDDFGKVENLNPSNTYIFELTAPENRVVKRYDRPEAVYLAARHNATGVYVNGATEALALGARRPMMFSFDSAAQCAESAATLPDLEEGYVVYRAGRPVCKIKSPRYVAAHRLFSGPLTTKRSAELLLTGEADELIAYFPEFGKTLAEHAQALRLFLSDVDRLFRSLNTEPDQKAFALSVKGFDHSSLMFQARHKGIEPSAAFTSMRDSVRTQIAVDAIDGATNAP